MCARGASTRTHRMDGSLTRVASHLPTQRFAPDPRGRRPTVHSGGIVTRNGRWVPTKKKCPPHTGPQVDTTSVRDGTGMRSWFNATLDHESEWAARRARRVSSPKALAVRCAAQRSAAAPPSAAHSATGAAGAAGSASTSALDSLRKPRCTDRPGAIGRGVRLLLGVHSVPSGRVRRDAIRASWMRWPSASVLVCFLLGARGAT